MENTLEDMVALVTGSGRGMGRTHAELLASRGADVIVHDMDKKNANFPPPRILSGNKLLR